MVDDKPLEKTSEKTEEKVYSNFEQKEVKRNKKIKENKKYKKLTTTTQIIIFLVCIGFIVGLYYISSRNTNKELNEMKSFCNQYNMTYYNNNYCYIKINENLIQKVKVEKGNGNYTFVQEGLR